MLEMLSSNWEYVLIAILCVDKVVALSPTKYDDIVLDVVWKSIKKAIRK